MRALALCTSLAAGVKANLGSMAKPMHIGHASRSGLLAALLAAEGFTANADAFEHAQGFLELFNGSGTYSVERILEKWGEPWEIEMPGIAVKQYPCCLSTQSAIDLMLKLVEAHDLEPDEVAFVDARVSARRLEHTNRPQPRNALDAKLSVHYVLARALADRKLVLSHFEGDAHRDGRIQHLMKVVAPRAFDEATLEEVGDSGATITIALKDGRQLSGKIGRPVGHEPGTPIPPALHKTKYQRCVERHLSAQQAAALYDAVQDFENVADVRCFTEAFEVAPAAPAPVSMQSTRT
jgi:2-methylcitrate dehydratase PrpD